MRKTFICVYLLGVLCLGQACAQNLTIVMKNGDRLGLGNASMDGSEIVGELTIGGGAEVKIAYTEVNAIEIGEEEDEKPSDELELFEVRLQDSGILKGEILSLTSGMLELEALGVGGVKVPVSSVESISREGFLPPPDGARMGEGIVAFDGSSQMAGRIEMKSLDEMSIVHKSIETKFSFKDVSSVKFGGAHEFNPEDANFLIYLAHGCRLYAKSFQLIDGVGELTVLGGKKISLPLSGLRKVFFTTGSQIAQKRVLLLSCLSAEGSNEMKNTLDALNSGLDGWEVFTESDLGFLEDFEEKLMTCRAVVIPEVDSNLSRTYNEWLKVQHAGEDDEEGEVRFGSLRETLANNLFPKLKSFLDRGGNVIYLGLNRNNNVEEHLTMFPVSRKGDRRLLQTTVLCSDLFSLS